MTGYKYAKPTKNGKTRCFKFSYNVKFDATKQYRFKRYSSREEESDAERIILGNYYVNVYLKFRIIVGYLKKNLED